MYQQLQRDDECRLSCNRAEDEQKEGPSCLSHYDNEMQTTVPSIMQRQWESLGEQERRIFESILRFVTDATGLSTQSLPLPKDILDYVENSSCTVNDSILFGQALLSAYRHVKRGVLPDKETLEFIKSQLPASQRALVEQDEKEINADEASKQQHLTRAGLANEILKEKGTKLLRLAMLPGDVAASVKKTVRLEELSCLQEVLARKFLKASLSTPEQIYDHLMNRTGVCNLSILGKAVAGDSDARDQVHIKLEMLMAAGNKEVPGANKRRLHPNSNSLFSTLSRLRQHGVTPVKLQLSRTARLKDDLLFSHRSILEAKRAKREQWKELARAAAAKIAMVESRRLQAKEREQRERMRALRERDMDSYMRLIKQTKNQRIHDILEHTEKLLQDIGAKIELERSAVERAELEEKEKEKMKETAAAKEREERQKEGELLPPQQQTAGGAQPPEATTTESTTSTEATTTAASAKSTSSGGPPQYYTLSHRHREKVEQPLSLVGGKLMSYQLAGLEFLVSLYNNNISGILADEMGLGKTIQTIALCAYLKERKNNPGPHLIAVPLSTLPNWATEFARWCPSLKVLQYRGDKYERRALSSEVRKGRYNVLLTTFEYILREKKVLSAPKWKFIIVDEGHKMKNVKSKFHSTLGDFKSTHRLLLTGTPLQNNLNELWSLLNFLMPQTFSSADDFERWFEEPFKDQFVEAGKEEVALTEEEKLVVINRLHLVLRPFLLRRVKADVLSDLPSKREYIIRIQLSKWQQLVYERLVNRCLKVRDSSGKITSKSVANVIMQLRKVANHPYLFLDQFNIDENLWRVSGKFEVLDRMIEKLIKFKHKTLIFCQMTQLMDIMGDYFSYKGIKYHRLDGSMIIQDRQERMDDFNDLNSDTFVFMLSTRAGGLGLNLQTADTVILFDSDWNPHADLQAQARAHRVGQKSEVRVFRYVTVSPVEELILAKAQHKLSIDEQIIQAGMFSNKFNEQEREERLRSLLSQKDNKESVRVTTPQELNRYMARNDEEEDAFLVMDQQLFGERVFQQLFEHDQALDDSEGVHSQSVCSSEPFVSEDHASSDDAGTTATTTTTVSVEEPQPAARPVRTTRRSAAAAQRRPSSETVAETAQQVVQARDALKIEDLLIGSGRLVGEDEIPQDIFINEPPKEDESSFYINASQDLGVRKSRLRAEKIMSSGGSHSRGRRNESSADNSESEPPSKGAAEPKGKSQQQQAASVKTRAKRRGGTPLHSGAAKRVKSTASASEPEKDTSPAAASTPVTSNLRSSRRRTAAKAG